MATGVAAATANAWLDALCRSVAYSDPAAFYVKLHLGDPGAAGATNAAANTTRQQATFSAASAGSITTSADLTWTNVPNAETYSHVSFWDAAAAGTFLGSDNLNTSRTVAVGDTFTILAGDLDLDITVIAAQMAYRAIGAVKKNAGSGNMASVGLPTGHVANDILILVTAAADNVVCSVNQSYTSKLVTNGTTSVRQEIWWKRDGGAEVAPTVTHAAGNGALAFIICFSGCITTGDPFSACVAQNNNGSATITAPTITPANLEDVCFAGSMGSNTNTTGAPTTQSGYSGTNPTFTERGDSQVDLGSKESNLALATGTSNGSATGSRTSTTASGYTAAEIDSIGALFSLIAAGGAPASLIYQSATLLSNR